MNGREGTLQHSAQFAEAGAPFVFDPGQGLPMFSGGELLACLKLASYCTVNDSEGSMLAEKAGLSLTRLADEVAALIVTRGAAGLTICAGGRQIDVPCVAPSAVEDPTGCGDAYRGGLLYGIANAYDWEHAVRLASAMGAIKIACRGGQNHAPSREDIAKCYQQAFNEVLW